MDEFFEILVTSQKFDKCNPKYAINAFGWLWVYEVFADCFLGF